MQYFPPIRVLLIEDDSDDAALVQHNLRFAGASDVTLHHESRLSAGIRQLAESSFDAVLLDLGLPDSHGIESYQRLRAAAPEVPVVILSGRDDDELAVEAIAQGAQDYISKDASNGEILARTLRFSITRNRLTLELQASEQRLRLLTKQLPAMLWTTDADLRFTSLRGAELTARRLEAEQLVGTGAIQAKHLVEAGRRMMGLDREGVESGNGHAESKA